MFITILAVIIPVVYVIVYAIIISGPIIYVIDKINIIKSHVITCSNLSDNLALKEKKDKILYDDLLWYIIDIDHKVNSIVHILKTNNIKVII
jgi:hypothetical protein